MIKPQLFMLPFSGGNAHSYQFISALLSPYFTLEPLELPGRGSRMQEALLTGKEAAASDYFRQLQQRLHGSAFAIYGHSLGARLAILLAQQLEAAGTPPVSLVITGATPPDFTVEKDRYRWPKAAFMAELKRLGGSPDELFENSDIYDFFEPILRADFEVTDSGNEIFKTCRINTPVCAIMGTAEENTSRLGLWKEYTSGPFTEKLMEGGHFFIHQHAATLARIIKESYDEHQPTHYLRLDEQVF